jgi:hypothetical protein
MKMPESIAERLNEYIQSRLGDYGLEVVSEGLAEIERLQANAVELRPDTLKSVDERSQLTGLPRESIVNAILTAAFSFEQDDLDRIMRRGEPQNERRDQ